MSAPARTRITEVAFTKNEGRFLLEWIAYHTLIGVTDFLVYTNDCEDGSPALLERLQEMGLAVHVPNPLQPGEPAQNTALNRALDHPLVKAADYVLQIDPDEFLCIKTGKGHLADLIALAPEADAICIQMRFFGDSGLARLGDGLVIEQLTAASPEDFAFNNIVKSLARNSPVFEKVTANHMPGFEFAGGKGPRLFNAAGTEMEPSSYNYQRSNKIPDAYRDMRCAQLNHYAVRTFADYRAKKYRGTAANNDRKLTMEYWHQRNRNEVHDICALRHLDRTRRLLAEWLADPVLAELNRRCFEAYAEIVKKAEPLLPAP